MLLLQILSSLVRQWRVCCGLERILIVLIPVGVVVAVVGSAVGGAFLTAAAFGLIVLVRTGAIASRYQQRVARAVKPLYQLRSEERRRDADLQELLAGVLSAQRPSSYTKEHVVLVHKLGELVEARQSWPTHRDIARYAMAAIGLRRETDSWLRHETGDAIGDAVITYYAKDNALAAERHRTLSSTVARLREIAPPARRSTVHQELVAAISRMDEMTTHQRVCFSEGNEAGVIDAAAGFAASGASMQSAIRRIRGLGIKPLVQKNSRR